MQQVIGTINISQSQKKQTVNCILTISPILIHCWKYILTLCIYQADVTIIDYLIFFSVHVDQWERCLKILLYRYEFQSLRAFTQNTTGITLWK